MKKLIPFILLSFTVVVFSCLNGFGNNTSSQSQKQKPATIAQSKPVTQGKPFDSSRNAFKCYFDTLKVSNRSNDNLVVSPLVDLIQMNSLVNATQTKSLSELFNMLEFNGTKQQWNSNVMKPLAKKFNDVPELQINNGIWIAQNYKVRTEFINTFAGMFPLYVKSIDFTENTAIDSINNWFANTTHNQITNLFDSVPSQTKILLGNAFFFHGQWEKRFNPEFTSKGFFTTFDGKEIRCPMMDQTEDFACYQSQQYQVLKMNYSGKRFYMLVFLPDSNELFQKLEPSLTADMIRDIEKKLTPQKVHVRFPKFKATENVDKIPILKKNGVKSIFEKDADFSALTDSNDVVVSQMFQRVVINVDEQGVEASGSGGMVLEPKSMPASFYADRPFIYIIKDTQTNQILFIGRFVNPTGLTVPPQKQPVNPKELKPVSPPKEIVPAPSKPNVPVPGQETVI